MMRIIISPAKKMREDTDSLAWSDLPQFLPEAETLRTRLRGMPYEELKKLWKCNDSIAQLNADRLAHMELHTRLTPAILAYEGIQYRYITPEAFTDAEFAYLQEHLRILSGFYGLLRPFDGVVPYRLEMRSALAVGTCKDLYAFWGDRLARQLFSEADCIVNLASKEYSQCIARYLPRNARMVTCVFGEKRGGRVVEKGTLCKMARGEMVRFLTENRIEHPEAMKAFSRLEHRYSPEDSTEDLYVFLRQPKEREEFDGI